MLRSMSFTSPVARWSDVRIAAGARGLSTAGDMLAATALVLAMQSQGFGGTAVAALLTASTLPMVLFAPLAGRIVDRVDSRFLLLVVGLLQAACCLAMAYTDRPVVLVALVASVSLGLAVSQPTFAALLPNMVGPQDLPRASASMQTASALGMLAGPALAGVLVGAYGLRVPLLVDAGTYLGIVLAGLLLRTRRNPGRYRLTGPGPVPARGADRPDPAAPPWRLRDDPVLFGMVGMLGASIAAVSLANVVEVFYLRADLHATTTMYGLLSGTWALAMMVGSRLTARLRRDDVGFARTMVLALVAVAAAVGATALVPSVGWVVPLFLIGGVANGSLNTIAGVLLGRRVPEPVRGRANARFGAVANATNLVGFLLGGVLLGPVGPRTLMFGAGTAGVLVVVGLAPLMWRTTRRERSGAADPAPLPAPAVEAVS